MTVRRVGATVRLCGCARLSVRGSSLHHHNWTALYGASKGPYDCQERDPLRPDTPRPQCQNSPHDGHRPAVCPVSSFSQVRDQLTLLAAAAKAGSWRIVDLLLNAGANSTQDWQRPDGATAVSLAAAGTQREPPL